MTPALQPSPQPSAPAPLLCAAPDAAEPMTRQGLSPRADAHKQAAISFLSNITSLDHGKQPAATSHPSGSAAAAADAEACGFVVPLQQHSRSGTRESPLGARSQDAGSGLEVVDSGLLGHMCSPDSFPANRWSSDQEAEDDTKAGVPVRLPVPLHTPLPDTRACAFASGRWRRGTPGRTQCTGGFRGQSIACGEFPFQIKNLAAEFPTQNPGASATLAPAAKLHRAWKALHTTTFLGVSVKFTRGFHEIYRSDIYHREFDLARTPPPPAVFV